MLLLRAQSYSDFGTLRRVLPIPFGIKEDPPSMVDDYGRKKCKVGEGVLGFLDLLRFPGAS